MFTQILDLFNRLPLPAKAASVIIVVGSFAGLALVFEGQARWVLVGGVVLVVLALLVYGLILGRIEKRKESPMYKALLGNAAAAPTSISEPARRARLDDLRKNFESGLEKFRSAGKSVYAVPWYVMVGEPGSGKTEMIRHSNIGFPPGLQDQLQGAGGTLNMHWWFANSAVIIDTAGRLMFEEVEPGTSGEWEEMLKQLRRSRPTCPINGMFLVIPAESLIRDTSEAIERKGGRIAQQLDSIQRTLGVRFPVFVIITKCDLINGFREFFDEINDPQLQHQMLGWSNPAPLDTPFNPELVEEHLKTVQMRLARRRTGLLLDPVNTEDPKSRRTDQVDALYAFPDSLIKVGPRLKRYLEMIFVAGEWSQKPLFLRGIYFNSAMREGAALDAELAEALGVPLENLPEGRVWSRDRSFFIRDVMIAKVFRERGLVTRAVNTSKLQRRRRSVVLGTAAAGLLLLLGLTVVGYRSLGKQIAEPTAFWKSVYNAYLGKEGVIPADAALDTDEFYRPIVTRNGVRDRYWNYRGNEDSAFASIDADRSFRTIARFPALLRKKAEEPISVNPVFWWLGEGNLLKTDRVKAAESIVEGSIIRPLVNAAEVRLEKERLEEAPWSPEANAALAQLVRLEMASLKDANPGVIEIDPLLRYAVKGDPNLAAAPGPNASEPRSIASKVPGDTKPGAESTIVDPADAKDLQGTVAWLYASSGGNREWPPLALQAMSDRRTKALTAGVDRFLKAWDPSDRTGTGAGGLGGVLSLIDLLDQFNTKETELLAMKDRLLARDGDGAAIRTEWNRRYSELKDIGQNLQSRIDALLKADANRPARSIKLALEAELDSFRKAAKSQHELLLNEFKPIAPDSGGKRPRIYEEAVAGPAKDRADALDKKREEIAKSLAELTAQDPIAVKQVRPRLAEIDDRDIVDPAEPAVLRRLNMYQIAASGLAAASPPGEKPAIGATRDALEKIAKESLKAASDVSAQVHAPADAKWASAIDRQNRARDLSLAAVECGAALSRSDAVGRFQTVALPSADAIGQSIGALAASRNQSVPVPQIPGIAEGTTFDNRFTPLPAADALADYISVRAAISASSGAAAASAPRAVFNGSKLESDLGPAMHAGSDYLGQFASYWTTDLWRDVKWPADSAWSKFVQGVGQVAQASSINSRLEQLAAIQAQVADRARRFDRAGLTDDDQKAVDRLMQGANATKASLASGGWKADCDSVLAKWKALSKADAARDELLSAADSGAYIRLLLIPENRPDAADDLARGFWLRLSQSFTKSLVNEKGGVTRDAVQRLTGYGFPLGSFGSGAELQPGQLNQAVADGAIALKALDVATAAPHAGGSANKQIDDDIAQIRTQNAIHPDEQKAIRRIAEVLTLIEKGDLKCKVSVLPAEPPKNGAHPIAEYLPDLDFGPPDQPALAKAAIINGGVQPLTEIAVPSGPYEIRVYSAQRPEDKIDPLEFPSHWGPLSILAAAAVRDGRGQSFKVEFPIKYRGGTYSLWLSLEFSKPLPEGWPAGG